MGRHLCSGATTTKYRLSKFDVESAGELEPSASDTCRLTSLLLSRIMHGKRWMLRFRRRVYMMPPIVFTVFAFWFRAGIDVVGHAYSFLKISIFNGLSKANCTTPAGRKFLDYRRLCKGGAVIIQYRAEKKLPVTLFHFPRGRPAAAITVTQNLCVSISQPHRARGTCNVPSS